MTTKEYLSQIYLLNVKVKTKRQQAAELRNSIAGISRIDYTGIKVQTTPTPKMQEAIDRLISLEERIAQEILEMEQKKGKNRQPDQSPEKSATYPDLKDAVS